MQEQVHTTYTGLTWRVSYLPRYIVHSCVGNNGIHYSLFHARLKDMIPKKITSPKP